MLPSADYRPLLDPPFRDPNLKPDAQAIQAFAVTNGWEYYVGSGPQSLPGIVFRDARGRSRKLQRAGNIVRIPGSPLIEIGNSAYSVAVNLNLMSITWGYVAVPLRTPLPPFLLESERARTRSPLPALPDGVTTLRLTGADAAVTAHVAPAAADWLRAVVAPELASLLDDPHLPIDVEVAEGWLLLYAPVELSTPDPAVWQRAFAVLGAVVSALGVDFAPSPTAPAATPAPAAAAAAPLTAPAAPSASPSPSPSRSAAPPVAPRIQEKSWRVNRGRVLGYYGAALGVLALLAAGVALFVPR
ncbi:hypothetical protein LQ938_00510 [Microbacterium sp. cx-55]|uniref:hypothetical protein n=1 Tax=Microbacterium sp. cx-55 TaxID=2875948 RepID=UPI001CBFFC6E|nr:hypothetical protein [Microbacterium sp. cx-55]MBZ4487286.1 hypothetical protein [Microbacterium sp. cx-55]UGB35308.1 hypothetical protein LQ938_00510 [Microbacterium sp. cx-55]